MNTYRVFLLIAALLVFLFIFISLMQNPESNQSVTILPTSESSTSSFQDIQREAMKYNTCILTQLAEGTENKERFWRNLLPAVENCVNETRFGQLPVIAYPNRDEIKYYLHEAESEPRNKSVVLTLGIGKDVLVEAKLKEVLSQDSEFFGSDPMLENQALYSPIGHYFPLAVGKDTGMSNASVLTGGRYKTVPMMHIDIMTFMKSIIRRNIFDMFLMDNEGPEYDIQPMMGRGREFDQAEITVCQINGEFHGNHLDQLHEVLMDVFTDNRFIPIKIVRQFHVRLFMINIDSTYCVERYLAGHFDQI